MHNVDTLLRRPFIMGHELRTGIESLAHHLRSALGLRAVTVEWAEGISTAGMTEKGRLLLAAVRDDARITRPVLVRYVGYVIHELLHRKSTDFGQAYYIGQANHQYRRALLNAVEDARIEREAISAGLLGNVAGVLHDLVGQLVTEAIADVQDWGDPKQYPFSLAVALRDYPGLAVPMPQEVQRIAAVALPKMQHVRTTQDARELSEWIYTQLQAIEDQPQQPQQPQQNQQQPEQGQQQQGDQGDAQQADDQGQQGQQGAQQGPQKAAGDAETQGEGEGEGREQQSAQNAPKARKPSDWQAAREVEPTTGGRSENEGTAGTWCKTKAVGEPGQHTHGAPKTISTNVPARLRYELRKLFENTAQTLHLNNRKTGRLNPAALARVDVSQTVFRKRLDIEGVDSAVVICLDLSGSMYDNPSRIEAAIPATYALADTLTAAGVNVAVITFDRQASVAVPFDTSRRAVLDTVRRIYGGEQHTNDWAAVRTAHDMLLQRHEARRVVFVVSDGCGHVDAMRAQIKAGETMGITTLGVGIALDVSDIYGAQNCITVRKPADLGTAAFSRMKLAA